MSTATTAPTRGIDLPALRDTYRRDLFDGYLPFLERFVVDDEFGGFCCSATSSGERLSTTKRTWYEGRGMWVYAYLYNNFGGEQRHLDIALRSRDLLTKSRPAAASDRHPRELRPAQLQRDGQPAGPPDPEVYGDLFVAEGLAELANATGDESLRHEAKETIQTAVAHYDSPGYAPYVGRTYVGPDAPPLAGARVLGVWMVLIRTLTQFLDQHPDDELNQLLQRCLDAVLEHHLNPRFQLLNEVLDHDLSPSPSYERLVYLGHAIETLWMVLSEARRRSDDVLFARAAALFRHHCEVASDRVYGGLFRNLLDVDRARSSLDKTLWVHQEALLGALLLVEAGDPWAARFHQTIDAYTRTAFSLQPWGSPLWRLKGDRQLQDAPAENRVENYHHPRFLMLSLQTIDRILAAQDSGRILAAQDPGGQD